MSPRQTPEKTDERKPQTLTWSPWHGCTRVSAGCAYCTLFARDEAIGKNPQVVRRTKSFYMPVERYRIGAYRDCWKVPSGSLFLTCMSSDFFHPAADLWRGDAWSVMRERSDCTFFLLTKRIERIASALPADWGDGWDHVHIGVTCENQAAAERRLPLYLSLPLKHRSVMAEPLLSHMDLLPWLKTGKIESLSAGGERGPQARPCSWSWVLSLHVQCVECGVAFHYRSTGAKLIKDGKLYRIPEEYQQEQARKAGLEYDPSGEAGRSEGE